MIRSHEGQTLISPERLSYNEYTHFLEKVQGAWALLAAVGEPAGCKMTRILPTGPASGGVDRAEIDLIVTVNQITQILGRRANMSQGMQTVTRAAPPGRSDGAPCRK